MLAKNVSARRTGHQYPAESLRELPDELRQLAEQSLPPDDPIREIFAVPAQAVPRKLGGLGGVRNVPQQALIFTAKGALHVLGAKPSGGPPEATYMRAADLLSAHLIIVLLYGRLELHSASGDISRRVVVEYNTVGQDLIQPGLIHLLHLACKPVIDEEPSVYKTRALLSELEGRAFEFKNGLEFYALQDDEPLLGYVYQPRILKRYLRVVRRLIAPASIIALTDRELIMIEEGRTNATSYGWFFTFCPRTNILGIETRPEGALQELQVHLIKDQVKTDHSVAMDDETAQAWRTLWMGHSQQYPAVN